MDNSDQQPVQEPENTAGKEGKRPKFQRLSYPVKSRKRILFIGGILLGFAFLMMGSAQLFSIFLADDIESIIARDGLRPIRPVSNTYSVGDLHTVNFFGEVGNAVCRSRTEETIIGKGEDKVVGSLAIVEGTLGFDAGLPGSSGGQSEVQLEVRLANIKFVSAHSESVLRNVLRTELVSEPDCKELIEQKLAAGYCLAQIFAIMIADGTYSMSDSRGASILAEQPELVASKIRTDMDFDSNIFKIGKELHYGVKMDSLCLTPRNALLVRTVPDSRWWVLAPFKDFFHTAWKYFSQQSSQQASNAHTPLVVANAAK